MFLVTSSCYSFGTVKHLPYNWLKWISQTRKNMVRSYLKGQERRLKKDENKWCSMFSLEHPFLVPWATNIWILWPMGKLATIVWLSSAFTLLTLGCSVLFPAMWYKYTLVNGKLAQPFSGNSSVPCSNVPLLSIVAIPSLGGGIFRIFIWAGHPKCLQWIHPTCFF